MQFGFLGSSVVRDWEKSCDFCYLRDADGTLPLESQCLHSADLYIANSTFSPLAYGICFKSRDIVFSFNFKSLLSFFLFLFIPPVQNTNLCLSVLYCLICCHHFYFIVLSISFCVISFTWPVLPTVFIYFLSLLSCFISLIALLFIFHLFSELCQLTFQLVSLFLVWSFLLLLWSFFLKNCTVCPFKTEEDWSVFSGSDHLCCMYLSSAFCICAFLLAIPMLGYLLPGLFLGVAQIGIGAPSFLIDSSVGGGQGAWLTGLKIWLWSLPSYPTGPGELSPSGFGLQRVSVAHNERLTVMIPGLSLLCPAYPFACQPGFPNQRLFLNNKHGASSWFLFVDLPFPSPAAVCNVETDFTMSIFTDALTSPLWGTRRWCPWASPCLSSLETPSSSIFKASHGQMDCLARKMWVEVTWIKSTCSPPLPQRAVKTHDRMMIPEDSGDGQVSARLLCNLQGACSCYSIVATTKCSKIITAAISNV